MRRTVRDAVCLAHRIGLLLDMTPHAGFWIVIALIALAEAAIVVTALRMRVRQDAARGILGARGAEVIWTLLPVGLIAVLVAVSYGVA